MISIGHYKKCVELITWNESLCWRGLWVYYCHDSIQEGEKDWGMRLNACGVGNSRGAVIDSLKGSTNLFHTTQFHKPRW